MLGHIMEQKGTNGQIKVSGFVDKSIALAIDKECQRKGRCSRAALLRLILQERYQKEVAHG